MISQEYIGRCWNLGLAAIGLAGALWLAAPAEAQRPPTDRHVRELARYLDGVKISEPVTYRGLSVFPILVDDAARPRGRWLAPDSAIARGVLVVSEKGGGSVPIVTVENRSRDEYVFIMTGEVIAGGKQTRTVRHDAVISPGQRLDLGVLCVEAHRWAGGGKFEGGSKYMVPQSIQGELRKGAAQSDIWSEVARNNSALKAENSTGSLERALESKVVKDKLDEVRRKIVPDMPAGTVGYVFVAHGRAAGAEFFGREDLARDLLPKLLDSYAVDYVILREPDGGFGRIDNRVAIDFFERVCRAGSDRTSTPGSGSGIRTRESGLLGDGASFDEALVHYGVQQGERVIPRPKPNPPIIWPRGGPEQRSGR